MKRALPILLIAVAALGCGGDKALVDVRLTAAHPRPEEAREVWSMRFRAAREQGLLPVARASARLEPPGLVLNASVEVERCDDAIIARVREAIVDLSTGHHTLAVHRIDEIRAEELARHLRATLRVDVATPFERPGQVVVQAPLERVRPLLDGVVHVVEGGDERRVTLWILQAEPALDGSAVSSAAHDEHAVEVTLTDAGAVVMSELSDAVLGKPLVFVVDGEFALAPRVLLRLTNSVRLDLPASEAHRVEPLARAIAASNLADPPTLIDAEASCRSGAR